MRALNFLLEETKYQQRLDEGYLRTKSLPVPRTCSAGMAMGAQNSGAKRVKVQLVALGKSFALEAPIDWHNIFDTQVLETPY